MLRVAVIGGGSWGTTLALLLAEGGHRVSLWVYEGDLARQMQETRENTVYLPGFFLPENVHPTSDPGEAVQGVDFLVWAVPSHVTRATFRRFRPHLSGPLPVINASKGMEEESLLLVSQVLLEEWPPALKPQMLCLSGPSFAREVAQRLPTAVTLGASDPFLARKFQQIFARPYFRVYTNPDLLGVELGGALKNVIAIAAGCADGLGFGHSTRAALITRGLAEMTRLGVALGARADTFFGLAGVGDLVLTCTGELSRNRTVGLWLGRGKPLSSILAEMKMVAEGVRTTRAVRALARRHGVEMPITEAVYGLLYEGRDPRAVTQDLMLRELVEEWPSHAP